VPPADHRQPVRALVALQFARPQCRNPGPTGIFTTLSTTKRPAARWLIRLILATIGSIQRRLGGGPMSRNNVLFLVVGALAVVVAILGYQLYQDRKKPEGVNINLGPGGISIQKK
jgi:RsiW-degrading membrane proteinase PrsW (M82 family)